MASELRRPPTRTGSGSRPPTSRFQEGSMNDRASAAPPAQFLGPEQLRDYEGQFYADPPTLQEARRPRPFSASAQLPATTISRHAEAQPLRQQQQQNPVAQKKSSGFFGRVRDALFHRGGQHGQTQKQQEIRRKHSSLQEPLQHPLAPPPPRPDYMHAGRTQSEVNVAQVFPNPRGAADRPTREDVMASYNELVASGFFQSHAIQSTRHAPPTAAARTGGRQTPVLPMDRQAAPRPPVRIASINESSRSGSVSPMPMPRPSPNPQKRNSREYASATLAPPVAPRSSLSSLLRPSIPDLNTKDSRYTLRGRKRTRGDGDETPVVSPEPQASTSSTSYFTQPLRRVAKKLREMPSSSSQLNETARKHKASASQQTTAEGALRLVPTVSNGGSLHPNDRPIRLRSPSPVGLEAAAKDRHARKSERVIHERASPATARRPRRTFSYTVTESARGRSRPVERERERDMSQLQRRGSSASRADGRTQTTTSRQTHAQNALGQWQRVSVEDTIIHRDSSDSTGSQWEWGRDADRVEVRTATSPNKTRKTPLSQSPLRAIPDANRSIPKAPERWHGSGKAYHLKDRGSRPDLTPRQSEDGGKENDCRGLDADGDVDVFACENRRPQEGFYQQQPQQWRIGNAL